MMPNTHSNIPKGLTVFDFPEDHRIRLRITNGLERVSQELRRRTRVVRSFPNEASYLRLVSAMIGKNCVTIQD